MPEKLPDNFEQVLDELQTAINIYQQLQTRLTGLHSQIDSQKLELKNQQKYAEGLRYQKVYHFMDEQNLDICSAEIIPREFKIKHPDIKRASELEKLGLFSKGKLRFIYFYDREYHSGGYEQHSEYYEKKYILNLCPYHFPLKKSLPTPSPFTYSRSLNLSENTLPHFQEVIKKDENNFIDKSTGKLIEAEYKTFPISENIFKYFQIPPLPMLRT